MEEHEEQYEARNVWDDLTKWITSGNPVQIFKNDLGSISVQNPYDGDQVYDDFTIYKAIVGYLAKYKK